MSLHPAPIDEARGARWYEALRDLPVSYHLYCAELELRLTDTCALSDDLRRARLRNLDVLRTYRQIGRFPRNTHAPGRIAPVFLDDDGRRCAVAHLMIESGAHTTAAKIAAQHTYARIREMDADLLNAWAPASGLTTAELARIQPGYCTFVAEAEPVIRQTLALAGATINVLVLNTGLLLIRGAASRLSARNRDWAAGFAQVLALGQWALYAIGLVLGLLALTNYNQLDSFVNCTQGFRGDTSLHVAVGMLEYSRVIDNVRMILWVPTLVFSCIAILVPELLAIWYRRSRAR